MIWVRILLLFAAVVSPSDLTSDIVKGKEIRNRRCWFGDFLTAAGTTGIILVLLSSAPSVIGSILCVFLPGGSSLPDTRRRCCRRLRSLPSGRRCQPDESLSHGFIDGQSRLRRRLKCQVDSQTDGRVAAAAAATAALDLDLSRSRRSFWSCKSRKSFRFQQVPTSFCRI